ncbi:MAG TPA: serine/threonine-protein kinase, partial [Polyangiaceae bacterium]|nr:serine/threonine-protein kinase [Polyangiaceae bacterium]
MSERIEASLLDSRSSAQDSMNGPAFAEPRVDSSSTELESEVGTLDDFCSTLTVPAELEAVFIDPSPQVGNTDADGLRPLELGHLPTGEPRLPLNQVTPGARVGRFEIIRELGGGGMGTVYLARDCQLGRRVAIKFLRTTRASVARRFATEGAATARCMHENIVVLHEVGEIDGRPYIVFEYLQGQTIADLIRTAAPMTATRAVDLIVPVVRALVCAHDHGIVHRDLKPGNILLTSTGTVKVLDFGIAKLLDEK